MELTPNAPGASEWPRPIVNWVISVQTSSLWVLSAIGFLALSGLITRKLGKHWVWGTLKFVLDEFQKKAYPEHQGDRNNHHRVTLFQRKQCVMRFDAFGSGRYPWSGWLEPVLRSGHKTLDTKALFHAPENAKSEGIGGYTWDSEMVVCTQNLPKVLISSSLRQKEKYAKRTFCNLDFIDKHLSSGKELPLSLGAIPVFVNGSIWGVLVLDSMAPEGVSEEVLSNFTLTVNVIGKLLEKA